MLGSPLGSTAHASDRPSALLDPVTVCSEYFIKGFRYSQKAPVNLRLQSLKQEREKKGEYFRKRVYLQLKPFSLQTGFCVQKLKKWSFLEGKFSFLKLVILGFKKCN